MDQIDKRILSTLQQDSSISMATLSDRIGLSLSACHRRVKILETEGFISGYSARLSRKALGLGIQIFIEVQIETPRREDMESFEKAIQNMPEVLECHLITGEFDYLIRLAVKDTENYEALYRERLSTIPSVSKMKTLLSMSSVKDFSGYYLD